MSETPAPILSENLPTVAAVAAVAAILALAYAAYVHQQLTGVALAAATGEERAERREAELDTQLKALNEKIAAIEAKLAAPPPVAEAPAPAEAPK